MGHRPGAGERDMELPRAPIPKGTRPSGGTATGEGGAEMSGEAQVLAARPAWALGKHCASSRCMKK